MGGNWEGMVVDSPFVTIPFQFYFLIPIIHYCFVVYWEDKVFDLGVSFPTQHIFLGPYHRVYIIIFKKIKGKRILTSIKTNITSTIVCIHTLKTPFLAYFSIYLLAKCSTMHQVKKFIDLRNSTIPWSQPWILRKKNKQMKIS